MDLRNETVRRRTRVGVQVGVKRVEGGVVLELCISFSLFVGFGDVIEDGGFGVMRWREGMLFAWVLVKRKHSFSLHFS